MHERLIAAAAGRTYRHVAELTSTNAETVRRYMNGQSPSAEFLQAMCAALGLSGTWLLTGVGPMRADEITSAALRQADPSDLLGAMAGSIETLIDRVSRLELYVHTMETRVRAGQVGRSATESDGTASALSGVGSTLEPVRLETGEASNVRTFLSSSAGAVSAGPGSVSKEQASDVQAAQRASKVAKAIPRAAARASEHGHAADERVGDPGSHAGRPRPDAR